MEHEQIPEAAGVQRLFGTALRGVELDGDVVPGVLAGYHHRTRVRRFQATGAALAVLAVAAVGVSVLPGGDATGAKPAAAASPSPSRTTQPSGNDSTTHCTQQWFPSTLEDPQNTDTVLAKDQARESAFCEALSSAVLAGVPGGSFTPRYAPDITHDPNVDQTALLSYEKVFARPVTDGIPKDTADFIKKLRSEWDRLATHPEDPLNHASPDEYTLATAMGRAAFDIRFADQATMAKGDTTARNTDCKTADSFAACAPVRTGDWHGTIQSADGGKNKMYVLQATLTDGRGHYVTFSSSGSDGIAWTSSLAVLGLDAQGHQLYVDDEGRLTSQMTWRNRLTGQVVPDDRAGTQLPPLTPALTVKQFTDLVAGDEFAGFLATEVPAYTGWK